MRERWREGETQGGRKEDGPEGERERGLFTIWNSIINVEDSILKPRSFFPSITGREEKQVMKDKSDTSGSLGLSL